MAGQIDRDKLRTSLRELGRAYIFYMLYDAIELMPSAKLQKLVEPYFDLETLRSDGNPQRDLLAKVASFARAPGGWLL